MTRTLSKPDAAADARRAPAPVIHNPILRGFNPDPSILRVGDDYYIANSTFEWFPGVQIHHSKDLVHWRLLTRPLDTVELLDMRGTENSCGIWAPNLSYADGLFHLVYTNVRSSGGPWKDTPNYLTTAPSITGPWSPPIFLNASGFDPSLFHDDDGRKWVINMLWDGRGHRHRFNGFVLQQYDPERRQLVGPIRNVWHGSGLPCSEGPNLYKRNGYYYLVVAEGGTGFTHVVTVGRSRSLFGPYELHPDNPLLSSRHDNTLPLQRAGHASFVETPSGEWFMAYLCSRTIPAPNLPLDLPFDQRTRSLLGRETALQPIVWGDDEWPRLDKAGRDPQLTPRAPQLPPHAWPAAPAREHFDTPTLPVDFQFLREPPLDSWCSLTQRPGWLRLRGRNGLFSCFEQSLVARRIQAFHCSATTRLDFHPLDYQQMAGLIAYYDRQNYLYLRITSDDEGQRILGVTISNDGAYTEPTDAQIKLPTHQPVFLRATLDNASLQFSWSLDEKTWHPIGPALDATIISDEHGRLSHFTGPFFGLCCQDLSGRFIPADFDFLEYVEASTPPPS